MTSIEVSSSEVQQHIENSGRFKRGLSKIFPKMIEDLAREKVYQAKAEQAEIERREGLGQKGRIKEDALRSVYASMNRDYIKWVQGRADQGITMPVGDHQSSLFSWTRTTSRYLEEKGLDDTNVLGGLSADRFAFAIGFPREVTERVEADDTEEDVFLIGLSMDFSEIQESHKLDDHFLKSLSPDDLGVLEQAATDIYKTSSWQSFMAHTDKYI